jgi:hypothetical protein
LLVCSVLVACAAPRPIPVAPVVRGLIIADVNVAQESLLDIGLSVFDPGIPAGRREQEINNIYPDLRRAEARYIPYVLRKTLERSSQWGAVRVLPQPDPSAELLVSGTVLHSDGEELRIQIRAWDASGRVWLSKIYSDHAGWDYYREPPGYQADPFQDLYDQVANDLFQARQKLSATELGHIIEISQLRYAAALSPVAFRDFLSERPDGTVELKRLPARNDPMMARVERLRQGEYLFIDTMDEQFASYYRSMGPTYSLWRRYSYGQTMELAELKQSEREGARGFPAMKEAYDNFKEGKIQQQALAELAESFNTEVDPIVMNLEGQVIQLSGSLQAQYSEWRRLLRAIFTEETGIVAPEQ